MSENSGLRPPMKSGKLKRWSVLSISTTARGIVFLCLALLVVICLAAVGSMRAQSAEVDHLILAVSPVLDNNVEIFRDMTEAQNAILRYQLSGGLRILTPYREARVRVLAALAPLHAQIVELAKHDSYSSEELVAEFEAQQRDAIKLWMANALKSERAVLNSENPNFTQNANLFEDFRQANSQLDELFKAERSQARNRARSASARGTTVVIAAAFVASVIMLLFGLRLARSISKPIIALSGTIKRQREGDLSARARENKGSAETRDLARDFNLLVEHESELEHIRSLALRMHELTVKIEHAIRIAANTQQALEVLCIELGTGLSVDRVLTNTSEADLAPMLRAQWHRPDLPPLGELPNDLLPHISEVSQILWRSSGHIVSNDRLAPEAQDERTKSFYRYTDARGVIVTPIGVGDQVIGMIYVVTTSSPRTWTEAEINAVDRVAAFLAQFIVEQTYRDQLNDHVRRLEQLNRQKDNFVATVSHELRTPLTSIIGYLEVCRDGYAGDLTDEQMRILDVIDRNAQRLLSLIQDLLALNKRESEAGSEAMDNVSMPELVSSVCHDLSPLAESGAIKIDCEVGAQGAVVQGDRGKLQSAIANIVSNAVKFSPRGGVVTIGCTLDETNHRVQFTCQDRGIGIPADDQGELFTRFYRASNAMTKFIPGTGLGLTIVKQIVDDHGGEVRLHSVEGEGTTVVIDLPQSPQGTL